MTLISARRGRSRGWQRASFGHLMLALCVIGITACGESAEGGASGGGAGESGNSPDDVDNLPDDLPDDVELTGTFTYAGKTLACKTSHQDFPATGEFSVVCDNDDDGYQFVQVTFKNEASARQDQDLTFMAPFAFKPEDHEAADAVAVSYTGSDGTLDSDDDSTGSAKVTSSGAHHVLTLTNVSLSTVTSEATGSISATIDF